MSSVGETSAIRRTRSKARKACVQALYACDIEHDFRKERFASALYAIKPELSAEVITYANELFSNVVELEEPIEGYLHSDMHSRNIDRVGLVERAILRMALSELAMQQVPKAVTISEALGLVETMADPDAIQYVNAVLDRAPMMQK